MANPSTPSIAQLIKTHEVKFVDLRFTDTRGKWQHVTIDVEVADSTFLKMGKMFDGSSIAGWQSIHESDMILRPDISTAFIDPFFEESTLVLGCDVVDPVTMQPYVRDPRAVARRAEAYLKKSGIADTCYVGPEPEFFIFDSVRWKNAPEHAFYQIGSEAAAWSSEKELPEGNTGHRPAVKGGYFPVPPIDSFHDLRSAMCSALKSLGLQVETHHHEVASAGQTEINMRFDSLLAGAEKLQLFKYVIQNVAHTFGKTVTFMPKPLANDNGSGMHCHMSLFKNGENLFAGEGYAGLSPCALHFIGGIIHHARALNAFTNPATNSYKRLVPGFEAPVMLAYSARNRSAAIRIPHVHTPKERRIEVRFPDLLANPYFAFSALMMAGLDGVRHKMDPGVPMDQDLYTLPPEALKKVPTVCASLEEALHALQADHAFLLEGEVFNKDLIDAYVRLKMEEVTRLRAAPHPVEFEMYYSA
jgi:glutamine synthetase